MIQERGRDDLLNILETVIISESCESMGDFLHTGSYETLDSVINMAFNTKNASYGMDLSYASKMDWLWIFSPEDILKAYKSFVDKHKLYCRSTNGDFGLMDFDILCIKCGVKFLHKALKIVPVSDHVEEDYFRSAMIIYKKQAEERDTQFRATMRKYDEDRKQYEIEVQNKEYLGYYIGAIFVIIIFAASL